MHIGVVYIQIKPRKLKLVFDLLTNKKNLFLNSYFSKMD